MPYWDDGSGQSKSQYDAGGGYDHHGNQNLNNNNNNNNNNPPPVNIHKGPTAADIEAEKQRKAAELQQRRAQQYTDFYNKFKGDTKKKTAHLKNYLKKDPLYNTYVNKGLLDWSNIKSFDEDPYYSKEEIEEAKLKNWGYTRSHTDDDSLYIAD
jgi:hypothetical protein